MLKNLFEGEHEKMYEIRVIGLDAGLLMQDEGVVKMAVRKLKLKRNNFV